MNQCALHGIDPTDVDPAILQKYEIWLGPNLDHPSKTQESIPFEKVSFADRLHRSEDGEAREVYCEGCLQDKNRESLAFSIQYEQNDEIKVSAFSNQAHLRTLTH